MKTILRSDGLSATIESMGAQLVSVRDATGREWLWLATPPWPQSAPLLFPIIGATGAGTIPWQGQNWPMPQHGFAARELFEVSQAGPSRATFALVPNEAIRAQFPFDFRFSVTYAVDGMTLSTDITIVNPADEPLPVQFGLHPGLVVTEENARESVVVFETEEEAPLALRRGHAADRGPDPLAGRVLRIEPHTFAEGGVLFERVRSTWIWHGVPGKPGVRANLRGFPHLALWSKPPGRFLCIEPWYGVPDRAGSAVSFFDRTGVAVLSGGAELSAHCALSFGLPQPG